MFVDQVKINVRGGKGGDGVTSFRRQPFEPKGPPEGANGGDGGDVVVMADSQLATLVDFHFRPHRKADGGVNGSGDLRHGARGDDEVLHVPVGTVVSDAETGDVLADLVGEGQTIVVAPGGRGGRGNAAFRTTQRRAPAFHESGVPGDERWLSLELKLLTDVALVGYPNGGKSSLIARLSAARPKIADYPFTTLVPNLGVVTVGDLDFVMADVPGLIEGAADGRGLGHEFLRHVERAGALVHVLDCASGYAAADDDQPTRRYEQRNPIDDLETVLEELRAFRPELVDRPAIVWLNKADADPDVAELVRPELEEAGWEVLTGSAVTGQGIEALRYRLADLVRQARSERREEAEADPFGIEDPQATPRPVLRPRQVRSGRDFTIEKVGLGGGKVGWRLHGERIERWVQQLDLDNEDAVAYLQGRLKRAGVEVALAEAGAKPGDDAEIAGSVFVFKPEDWEGEEEDDADEDDWDDDGAPAVFDVPAEDDEDW